MADLAFEENVPLAPFTTLCVGGPARFFFAANSAEEIGLALEQAKRRGLRVFVLGGGSNLLVADSGFDGLVIAPRLMGFERRDDGGDALITAGAGENWDSVVERCVANSLAGIECLSGIPGLAGGTPIQNVGAYGQEVSDTVVSVRCLVRASGDILSIAAADCGFGYRSSIFNTSAEGKFIVLDVTYRLAIGGPPRIAYKDLMKRFGDSEPSLSSVRAAVLEIRKAKGMVLDPDDPNTRSAGSFFKNPIVGAERMNSIRERHPEVQVFPTGEDRFKISAAWLIEAAGFAKGFRLGNAAISERHTLALVNRGGATAAEIERLRDMIRDGVENAFAITLIQEPINVGP